MSDLGDGGSEHGQSASSMLEIERKFRVHALYRLPEIRLSSDCGLGPAQSVELSAVYFDTADLRLARCGITLRRRTGGSDEGWHLKLPVGPEARQELSLPLDRGDVAQPPQELTDLVLALTRHKPLEIVAHLHTERTMYPVAGASGSVVAALTDDSVSVLDGDRLVARFRELEVELVAAESADGSDALEEISRALESSGAVRGGSRSKLARALGPQASEPPDLVAPPEAKKSDPARLAVQAHLARHAAALLRNDRGVRQDAEDSVHQMRVAARRLRSGLKVFEPLLDATVTRPIREELAWLAGVLGEVRDREVLRDRLLRDLEVLATDPHLNVDAAATRRLIKSSFAKGMAGARTEVLVALGSSRYLDLLDQLIDLCSAPSTNEAAEAACSDVLPSLVEGAWRRLARDAERLYRHGPDQEWHRTRIAAKRARYACEAVEPVFGKPARRLAERCEVITELLGEHQDAALAAETARSLSERKQLAASTAFVLGLLCADQRSAVDATRVEFEASWPAVSRRRWRRWLKAG